MATIYRCDKCHKDLLAPLEKLTIPAPSNNYTIKGEKRMDLCDSCLSRLHDWCKPDAKEDKL